MISISRFISSESDAVGCVLVGLAMMAGVGGCGGSGM